MAENDTSSRHGLRRTNSFGKNRFQETSNRLVHLLKREKEQAQQEFLSYEKIRWPAYKELVYRRKNQTYLPSNPSQIKKMLGLTKASNQASGKEADKRGTSSSRSRAFDKIGHSSQTDLKASMSQLPTTSRGDTVILNDIVTFDADFECANCDQVRRRGPTTFDVFIRNDTNGSGNLQWFYFRMKNSADFVGQIKINIVNFTKGNSLFIHVSLFFFENS